MPLSRYACSIHKASRGAVASTPVTVTNADNTQDTSGSGFITFAAQNFSTEDASRVIVVVVHVKDPSSSLNSVTIGGGAATVANYISSDTVGTAIAWRALASGTSGNVVVNFGFSATTTSVVINVYAVYDSNGGPFTALTYNSDPGTGGSWNQGTVDKDAAVIAGYTKGTRSGAITWTNATELYEAGTVALSMRVGGAVRAATGTTDTVTISNSHASDSAGTCGMTLEIDAA